MIGTFHSWTHSSCGGAEDMYEISSVGVAAWMGKGHPTSPYPVKEPVYWLFLAAGGKIIFFSEEVFGIFCMLQRPQIRLLRGWGSELEACASGCWGRDTPYMFPRGSLESLHAAENQGRIEIIELWTNSQMSAQKFNFVLLTRGYISFFLSVFSFNQRKKTFQCLFQQRQHKYLTVNILGGKTPLTIIRTRLSALTIQQVKRGIE